MADHTGLLYAATRCHASIKLETTSKALWQQIRKWLGLEIEVDCNLDAVGGKDISFHPLGQAQEGESVENFDAEPTLHYSIGERGHPFL